VSITDLERKLSELEKKLRFSKNSAEKMVYPRQIEELQKQLLLLKQKQGGKKYKNKQTRKKSRSKSKNYKSKKSKSNKKYSIKRNQKKGLRRKVACFSAVGERTKYFTRCRS
jgi:hypothetical protein